MRLILYGFYTYKNFGDELFFHIISNYLTNNNIEYILLNPSNIEAYDEYIDIILFGGGEVINDFFMFPLIDYMKKYNYKFFIYGVSIGCFNSIKLLDIFNICILRNSLNTTIHHNNVLFDNDIIFNMKDMYKTKAIKNKHTIGYYLIGDITTNKLTKIFEFTDKIKSRYHINFVLFHKNAELKIIKNIINMCNLTHYSIIDIDDNYKKIDSILSNEKHFCLRFHSHVICYTYNVNFISFPITNKTIDFNNKYTIKYSYDTVQNLFLLDNQNIEFKNIKFNYNNFDLIFDNYNNKKNAINSKESRLIKIKYIYNNLLKLLFNNNNLTIDDLQYYINIICDQIEFNIFDTLDTIYRYGINNKLNYIYNYRYMLNKDTLRHHFFEIITTIIKNEI